MNTRPAPGITVRLVSRLGEPFGVVSYYDQTSKQPYFPVEDEYGVTRLYAPEDVEPAWGPAMV